MRNLTDEQREYLGFLPENFNGNDAEKLVMAVFCYCNACAVERGDDTFPLGFDALEKMTGYSRSYLSPIVHSLIMCGHIERVKVGNKLNKACSQYKTRYMSTFDENNHDKTHNVSNTRKVDTNTNTKRYNKIDNIDIQYVVYTIQETIRTKEENIKNIIQTLQDTHAREVDELKSKIDSLSKRLDNAGRYIRELEGKVKAKHTKTVNTKTEFSQLFDIAKDDTKPMNIRLDASSNLIGLIEKDNCGILTQKQVKAAKNIHAYLKKNTKVESVKTDSNMSGDTDEVIVIPPKSESDEAKDKFWDSVRAVEKDYTNGVFTLPREGQVYSNCSGLDYAINNMNRCIGKGILSISDTHSFREWCDTHTTLIKDAKDYVKGTYNPQQRILAQ